LDEKEMREEKQENVRQRTKVRVKSQLQRAVKVALKQLKGKGVRQAVQNELTEVVRGKLKEKGKEFLLE
jgi:hypothetical protein